MAPKRTKKSTRTARAPRGRCPGQLVGHKGVVERVEGDPDRIEPSLPMGPRGVVATDVECVGDAGTLMPVCRQVTEEDITADYKWGTDE